MIILPLTISGPSAERPAWLSFSIAGLALSLHLAERWLLLLPDPLFALIDRLGLAWWRLGAGGSWSPLQVWSAGLIHHDLLHLGLGLGLWWLVASASERRLGPARTAASLLLIAPVTAALPLLSAPVSGGLALGLGPWAIALGAALAMQRPAPQVRWFAAWWALTSVGVARLRSPVAVLLLAWAALDLLRPFWADWLGLPPPSGDSASRVAALAVAGLLGIAVLGVLGQAPASAAPTGLQALAEGRGDLDDLAVLVQEEADPPLPRLERIAARCRAEGHRRAALALHDYLLLRAPSAAVCRDLGRWLGREAEP